MEKTFLNTYKNSHKTIITDFISTLQSIEINPTELCNRTCIFCPRSDNKLYKNQKKFISFETCEKIASNLSDIDYKGRIGFVGFGEPLLHPDIERCVEIIRKTCPTAQWIEVITNGDFLDRQKILDLKKSGCTDISISMYDKDDSEKYLDMFANIDIRLHLRHLYDDKFKENLVIIDRIGIMKNTYIENNNRPCYYPFYKMFIDWNGDYILCNSDWGKKTRLYNINDISIFDYWTNKLNDYRKNLIDGNRKSNIPCKNCNIHGMLNGKESFDFIATSDIFQDFLKNDQR
jgi:organic radical activating enzyme